MGPMLKLVQTCGACPEAYDVSYEGNYIGYLRLRHGCFAARNNVDEVVYSAHPRGDGIFEYDERSKYLAEGLVALAASMHIPVRIGDIVAALDAIDTHSQYEELEAICRKAAS